MTLPQPYSYTYIGQPYTAKHPDGSLDHNLMEQRYLWGAELTAKLLTEGQHVYSPIVHCHELAKKFELPRDFEFWKEYNYTMLQNSSKLLIAMMPGYLDSTGLTGEKLFAIHADLDIDFVLEDSWHK